MVMGMEPGQNMDPSSWLKLGSITNARLTEKILTSNRLPKNLGECMTQAVQYEATDILVKGVNLNRDSHILHVEEEVIEEVKDFKARANACWGCGEYVHFYRDCKAPNKQQYKSDHAPPVDEQPTGQLNIGMESQQPLTASMVDQFMQMVLCEKKKTKFAVKKYKDLKNINDDKKSMPTHNKPSYLRWPLPLLQKPVLRKTQNHL